MVATNYRIWRLIGVTEPFDPQCKLVTSPFFSPAVLAACRLVVALFSLLTLCITLGWDSEDGTGDRCVAGHRVICDAFANRSARNAATSRTSPIYPTLGYARTTGHLPCRQPSLLHVIGLTGRTHCNPGRVSYSSCTFFYFLPSSYTVRYSPLSELLGACSDRDSFSALAIITTAVFWSLLTSPDTLSGTVNGTPTLPPPTSHFIRSFNGFPFAPPNHHHLCGTAYTNISVHALNTALAGFEIFFTNMPPPPYIHMVFLVIMLAFYLAVAYITFATQHFYGSSRLPRFRLLAF